MLKRWILFIFVIMCLVALSFSQTSLALSCAAIINSASPSNTVVEKNKAAKFEKIKKDYSIDTKETSETPKIDEQKAIELAKKVSGDTALRAKNVTCYYAVITCPQLMIAAIQPDALEANPKIKEKEYLSEVPAWIVTFEGVNVQGSHNAVFADDNVVIDANTGKFLFGFQ